MYGNASSIAKKIKPSQRGESEIASVIESYMLQVKLDVTNLSRGTAWLDTSSPTALQDASSYTRVI